MVAQLIPKKVAGNDLMDAVLVALTKTVEERMLAPIVGNGNIVSGVSKLVLGALTKPASKIVKAENSKITKLIATGFVLDGTEDIAKVIADWVMGKVPAVGNLFGGKPKGGQPEFNTI